MREPRHEPVMVAEVGAALVGHQRIVVDATVGLGGHAEALLEAGAGLLIGLDRDEDALGIARARLARFGPRVELHHATFRELASVLGPRRPTAVLADLGVSSLQLDEADRGFSFARSGPLDMRMDRTQVLGVQELIAASSVERLEAILKAGEVGRLSGRYARALKEARRLETTEDLAVLVERATPARARTTRRHPATLVFQALRMAVNDELGQLAALLPTAFRALETEGVLAVLAYHSLEDRLVKRFFALAERGGADPSVPAGSWEPALVRSPRRAIRPRADEVARNPRSRSARLRIAHKVRELDLSDVWREEVRPWLVAPQ